MQQLTNIANSIITFINNVAVPLVFAVAFIVFIFGVFRYYIAGGTNAEKRKEGTQLIVYSLIGFAVMICVWGLVNIVVGTLGLSNNTRPCVPSFGSNTNCAGTTNSNGGTAQSPSSGTVQNAPVQNLPVQEGPLPGNSSAGFVGPRP